MPDGEQNRTDELYDVYAEFYDALHADDSEDIDLIRALARETGGPVLELMSGTGRVLLPLAREGHEVWGLDVNEAMMGRARAKLSQERHEVIARVHMVAADARSFALGRKFPLILLAFGSFRHLQDEKSREACLRSVVEHLESNGLFFVALSNPPTRPASRLSRLATIMWVPRSGIFGRIRERPVGRPPMIALLRLFLDVLRIWVLRHPGGRIQEVRAVRLSPSEELVFVGFETIDLETCTSRWDTLYVVIGKRGLSVRRSATTSLAIISKEEMEGLLDRSGLTVVRLMGGYNGQAFKSDSPEQVYVCQKKLDQESSHIQPHRSGRGLEDRSIL